MTGLLLLAFGADWLQDSEEINAVAQQETAKLQEELRNAQSQAEAASVLRNAEAEAGTGRGRQARKLRSPAAAERGWSPIRDGSPA